MIQIHTRIHTMLWTITKILLSILLLTACAVTVVLLDPSLSFDNEPQHLWLNLFPVILLTMLVYGVFRRIWASFLLMLFVLFLIFFINDQKLLNLNEPLMFADVMLTVQVATGWGLMKQYAPDWIYLALFILPVVFIVLCRLEKPAMRWQLGILPFAIGLAGFHFLMVGNSSPATDYSVWNNESSPWQFDKVASNQGLITSLVVGGKIVSVNKPTFEADTIENFMLTLSDFDGNKSTDIQPDIILWLSESFFDPAILKDIDSCQIWPQWCELKTQGKATNIAVNTFGGNTTRTEFEVLTGIPLPTLVGHHYPYLSVINSPTNSIAWQLKIAGYKTFALHPHDRRFWRRHRALPQLGIDQFEGEETFPDARRHGYYIADEELTTHVIDHLDAAAGPIFILAISMENHGPWGNRNYLDIDPVSSIPVPPTLDPGLARMWQEYIYHGANAVAELARLNEYIKTRTRPTLIVFFGDHLPALTPVFESLKYRDEELAGHSPLPALALANYQIEPAWLPQHAHELGIWTLKLAGQLGTHNYLDMNYALRNLYSNEGGENNAYSALSAMQIRQLYLPATPQPLDH